MKKKIKTREDAGFAARKIADLSACAVLVKGGHLAGTAVDVLWDGARETIFKSERIDTENTHGRVARSHRRLRPILRWDTDCTMR